MANGLALNEFMQEGSTCPRFIVVTSLSAPKQANKLRTYSQISCQATSKTNPLTTSRIDPLG